MSKIEQHDPVFLYDGSVEGFFSLVFETYVRKSFPAGIFKLSDYVPQLFEKPVKVHTHLDHAIRVLKALQSKIDKQTVTNILCSFLADQNEIEIKTYQFIRMIFDSKKDITKDYRDERVLAIERLARQVKGEAHRFKGLIRFQLTKDQFYTACIKPDHHIIPLLTRHFRNRFRDQKWIIFDVKRNMGALYDMKNVEYISFENHVLNEKEKIPDQILDENELLFQQLWRDYFNSVNISERKNLRLQRQHMPKRYWQFLPEMN